MSWRNFKFWLMKKMCSEAEWKTLLNIRQGFYDYQEEVKRMTRQEAADCLLDKVNCKYCDQADGDCRQEAIEMAARSLKAWDDVMKDVQDWQDDFNKHVKLLALTDDEKEGTMMYGQDVINIIGNHMVELKEVEE